MNWIRVGFINIILLWALGAHGQFYFLEDTYDQLEISFLRKKIETPSDRSFFNVLYIKNPTNRRVEFISKFSYPATWSFFGEQETRIVLNPNDSVYLPFRAAASYDAKGDIGYSIVASLTDLQGNSIKNAYSFINIPKIEKLYFKPTERMLYLRQSDLSADLSVRLANSGNTNELVYLDYKFDEALYMPGMQDFLFRSEVLLHPYSDTIVSIPVTYLPRQNYKNQDFHRVSIKAYTIDTVMNTSIWVKELKDNYYNQIPDDYKMGIIELNLTNIFKEETPGLAINVNGSVLLKNEHTFRYYFQGNSSGLIENPYKYSRFKASYLRGKLKIEGGDVSENYGQNSFGKGLSISYKSKSLAINSMASQATYKDALLIGAKASRTFKSINSGVGYSILNDNNEKTKNSIIQTNIGSKIPFFGMVSISGYSSILKHNDSTSIAKPAFAGLVSYSNVFKDITIQLSANTGQRSYTGNNRGRTYIIGRIAKPLRDNSYLDLIYTQTYYTQISKLITEDIYNKEKSLAFNFSKSLNRVFGISTSLNYLDKSTNQTPLKRFNFSTKTPEFVFNLRIKPQGSNTNMNLGGAFNYSFITDYDKEFVIGEYLNHSFYAFRISSNVFSRNWRLNLSYDHGPRSLTQQYSYFANDYYPKSLRVLPSVSIPLIKKVIDLESSLNYTYDVTGKVNRLNATANLIGYVNKTIQVDFNTSLVFQSNYDPITEEKYVFNNTYFELRIKKDIIPQQPRYQYHDLDVVFFKDFNGNMIQDDGEPGIRGILFSINKDENKTIEAGLSEDGNFMPIELLSDIYGQVNYSNVPNGFYTIEYKPVSEIKGAYTSAASSQSIYMNEDKKLYIPFTENNKIFGRVLLNRSKLSNLGQIDVSNIKVTAEDSYGKKFSALTNRNGEFVVFIPSVDRYKVSVNNIFFENFQLEQNNYEVQLNGYKQFEVNFVFNEKKRKINFESNYEYGSTLDGPGVEIVRRTNLSGTVKDATTLAPIAAEIRIVDAEGKEVAIEKSDAKSGLFTSSFIAGNNYSVEVNAPDYWFWAEKLYDQQLVTFKATQKDILMKAITVGSLIPMNTLIFESGSTEIPPGAFPELERLMKVLKKNPSVLIAVHGHADDMEVLDQSQDLALERAKMVAKYLIANGYNRVKYNGHANTKPIADNDTEDGRRQNRRVEIVVTGK